MRGLLTRWRHRRRLGAWRELNRAWREAYRFLNWQRIKDPDVPELAVRATQYFAPITLNSAAWSRIRRLFMTDWLRLKVRPAMRRGQ